MNTSPALTIDQALRRAVLRATLAPSVRNLQPWRFRVAGHTLEVHVDRTRRNTLDRSGRQSVISCGCALFNARVSLAADRRSSVVDRFPDPGRPDWLATLSLVSENARSDADIAYLDHVIKARRTSHGPFDGRPVTPDVVARLITTAAHEGNRLFEVTSEEDRVLSWHLLRSRPPASSC